MHFLRTAKSDSAVTLARAGVASGMIGVQSGKPL